MNARIVIGVALATALAACGAEDVDLGNELGKDASAETSCAPPSCGAAGASCTSRADCCSGACEPESEERKCLNFCRPLGAACETASDCCSLGCSAENRCTNVVCAVVGSACDEDPDCCSSHCDNQVCVAEQTACRRTGEGCAAGGDCCSNVCNLQTNRCDEGPGPTRPPLSPCTSNADCSAGDCVPNAQGIPVCASSCFADGAPCSGPTDCCSGACSSGSCGPASCEP